MFNSTFKIGNYDDNYFTSLYKKQYGKSYLEDFDNIYKISLKRINKILKYLKSPNHLCLLDIGSAMGFFLKAALDSGINEVCGIEISSFAANYCEKEFKIKVINSDFQDSNIEKTYDIISAWYFVEHCEDPLKSFVKIYNSLNKNGVFAFSVPSFFGPQYVFNRDEWMSKHPEDHNIDFSPIVVNKFLKRIGFKKIIIGAGGVHPERILAKDSFFHYPFNVLYKGFSHLFSFSDTLEVYAFK